MNQINMNNNTTVSSSYIYGDDLAIALFQARIKHEKLHRENSERRARVRLLKAKVQEADDAEAESLSQHRRVSDRLEGILFEATSIAPSYSTVAALRDIITTQIDEDQNTFENLKEKIKRTELDTRELSSTLEQRRLEDNIQHNKFKIENTTVAIKAHMT
eukprot:Tbor_TRINITY_DN4577_c0_g1::TRINITY_DN4577_c0_g1_i1::g.15837::m.15837